jgi:5,10-methylenetetrahydromethanopterin reductase
MVQRHAAPRQERLTTMFEAWNLTFPGPGAAPQVAQSLETAGWDGMLVADSQNLTSDVYVTLGAVAKCTSRLKIGTGVTNTVTRHVAVIASAAATLQQVSLGRFVLGIGRGDSAVAYLGANRASLASFERSLCDIQALLRGEPAPPVQAIQWLPQASLGKVPVDVAVTGARAIAIGAVHGDRLSFMVGATRDRLAWGIRTAREARDKAGLDPSGLSLGAYVNCVTHPDRSVGREIVRGSLATLLRFSSPPPADNQGLAAEDALRIKELAAAYDMTHHAQRHSGHSRLVTDDLIDKFAIVGPSNYCADRLQELVELGLTHVVISGHSRDADQSLLAETAARFAAEVLPTLKATGP